MKRIFWSLHFWIALLPMACKDGKSSAGSGLPAGEHTVHQSESSVPDKTKADGGHGRHVTDSSLLSVVAAANQVVLSDQGSTPARLVDTVIRIKGQGYVTWDVRRNRKIAARTGGRVERLFVKYTNQYIKRGQKIMDLYTPEINTYAAEYLHHVTTPGDEVLRVKAKEKLKLLGVSDRQIRQLEHSGFIGNTLSVYSNASGFVLFDAGSASTSGSMANGNGAGGGGADEGMGAVSNPSQFSFGGTKEQGQLREGAYVNRSQTLFYVNDFLTAWGVLSFDEATQSLLKSGMPVVIKSELLSRPVRSVISFIEPSFNNASQKFIQVRTYLPNSNQKLKINSLLEGTVDVALERKVVIPAASVFSLGKRKIVWVRTGTTPTGKNIFKVRDIQVSFMDKNVAVVTSGLTANEEVATDAGYLLDSQSLIEP